MNAQATPDTPPTPLTIGEIAQRIHLIRGQRVVLDADLAAFYGETTKRFNQQVNRNLARFPPGFMFQLEAQEFADLRLQIATSSLKGGHGGRRYAPLAFTEHGAIMASMVLNSQRATELSVYVVQAFVELRGMLSSNRELAGKVHNLERKVSVHERNIADLVDSMAQLLATPPPPPKRSIGFVTQEEPAIKPRSAKLKKSASKKT
ncbi:MAG: ORF6N domain-containing protein [Burkholderiales bacterium]|nr:ORF6N domain-containing protein [Burkholderiales bacterium]